MKLLKLSFTLLFFVSCTKSAVSDSVKKRPPAVPGSIDVFLIGGQSNAVGQGDSLLSPNVNQSFYTLSQYTAVYSSAPVLQFFGGALHPGNDPYGSGTNMKSNTGSAWPSFAVRYQSLTSHAICFVPAALNGTSQAAGANTGTGTWDTTGTMFAQSVSLLNSAMTSLTAAGYTPTFKGVLWIQGETDGIEIFQGFKIVPISYFNALQNMIRHYRLNYGATMPFYIFKIGNYFSAQDTAWDKIRHYQDSITTTDNFTKIVFSSAVNFRYAGEMKADSIHYTQAGLNEAGDSAAINVVNFHL